MYEIDPAAHFLQANALAPNWGQTIFQSANEIAANTTFRKRLDEIQAQTEAEKDWWEKRRASIQSEFMKELDAPPIAASKSGAGKNALDDDTVLVDSPASNDKGASGKKRRGKSDGGSVSIKDCKIL